MQNARIRKTQAYLADPLAFCTALVEDIFKLRREAFAKNLTPAVRLNGTSDIEWEKYGIFQKFPTVQFYDYTKWPASRRLNLPPNYHLTYSWSEKESAGTQALAWKMRGVNTAMVFAGGLPAEWKFYPEQAYTVPVIDGDESDLRFTDPKGVIVGLKTKGKARSDDGDGFVQHV